MTNQEILSHVDHTLLKATATWDEVKKLCGEAISHKTASVCIPPSFVKAAREEFGAVLPICTVIGFPLGYSVTAAKVFETEQAIRDGAQEIDMVINIGDVKAGRFDRALEEIKLMRKASLGKILKVIVETCYLDAGEKTRLCEIVTEAGADYIKTSTGFGSAGAALEDIALFRKHIGSGVKIKAAGGIKTLEAILAYLDAGCDRIGSSAAVGLLSGPARTGLS